MFPKMNLYVMDMIDTEFRNDFFDGLVSFYSIYHIPKKYLQKAFIEFNRILKPKGSIMLVTHKGTFTGTLKELWGYDDLELFATFHLENEIERLFADTGFTVDRLESQDTVYEFPKQRIIAMARKK
jgi:SAM-dependent methyltransferase